MTKAINSCWSDEGMYMIWWVFNFGSDCFHIGCESWVFIAVHEEASIIFILNDHCKTTEFKWHNLCAELKRRAPTLYATLEAASWCSRSKTSPLTGVEMAAGLLLKHRNQQMALLQTIVSIILYTGHASKKVCMICTLNIWSCDCACRILWYLLNSHSLCIIIL